MNLGGTCAQDQCPPGSEELSSSTGFSGRSKGRCPCRGTNRKCCVPTTISKSITHSRIRNTHNEYALMNTLDALTNKQGHATKIGFK